MSHHTPTPENQNEMSQHLESVLHGRRKPAFANDEIPKILRAVNSHEELLKAARRSRLIQTEGMTRQVANKLGGKYLDEFLVSGSSAMTRLIHLDLDEAIAKAEAKS